MYIIKAGGVGQPNPIMLTKRGPKKKFPLPSLTWNNRYFTSRKKKKKTKSSFIPKTY